MLFLGTTRVHTEGRGTVALDYESYREMALVVLHDLESQAQHAGH